MSQCCYNSAVTSTDPTREPGRYDALFAMLRENDAAIDTLYDELGVAGVRSRFVLPMIRLAHEGPLTISGLAESLDRTHSAVSQTVAAMRREGLVESAPGPDARTRVVSLTDRGRDAVPVLEAEWRATEAAVAELDDDVDRALSRAVESVLQALRDRPFAERLRARLTLPDASASAPAPGSPADSPDAGSGAQTGER